jgi:hypothetical protein
MRFEPLRVERLPTGPTSRAGGCSGFLPCHKPYSILHYDAQMSEFPLKANFSLLTIYLTPWPPLLAVPSSLGGGNLLL